MEEALAGFCRETGIATIAEKVEQEAHAAEFELLGLTHAQGYHFGRPLAQPNAVAAPPKIKLPDVKLPDTPKIPERMSVGTGVSTLPAPSGGSACH